MPLSLQDELLSEFLTSTRPEPIQFRLTLGEVRYGYGLGWSFAGSFILHAVVIFCIFFLSFTISRVRPVQLVQVIDLNDRAQVIYLPVLGGGAEGNGHPGGLSGIPLKRSAPAAARGTQGFNHPGLQPILSDQPKPDSRRQTLLQPGLKDLLILERFVPLPNIVQATNAAPVLDVRANKPTETSKLRVTPIQAPKLKLSTKALPDLKTAEPDLPVLQAATAPAENPKLELPPNEPEPVQALKVSKQRLEKSSAPVAPPKLEQVAPSTTRGADLRNLVALSSTPALPQSSPKIPKAEAHGRFSVSPQANTPQSEPGSKAQGSLPSTGAGIGAETNAPAGNKVDELVAGAGVGTGGSTSAGGGGVGHGAGSGTGWGKGGTGTIGGRGSESGVGLGTASGITTGSGTGAGGGRGAGNFPGITIQGGSLSGGGTVGTAGKPTGGYLVPPQRTYGMTVVSTASSGGGLPDLGVFASEKVYSVYLDMRTSTSDQIPSWTLQYAPLRAPQEETASIRKQETVTPPYLLVKEVPKLPIEMARKYQRRTVIVYAIMDTQGKLDQILVMQSPAAQLTDLILEALNKWVFRPAELDGQPVSIKLLLGVPVYRSE